MISTMGGGVAAADFDGDGWTDLFFTGSAADAFKPEKGPCGRLYRNRGDGSFEDATAKSGIRACGWQMAASWVDIDSDGLPDLIVAGLDETTVWHNRGDGTFREVSRERGLVLGHHFTIGAAAGDIRRRRARGPLLRRISRDFPRARALVSAFSEFEFRKITRERTRAFFTRGATALSKRRRRPLASRIPRGKGTGAVFFDYDGDGRQDLFVANDLVSNRLYRNLGRRDGSRTSRSRRGPARGTSGRGREWGSPSATRSCRVTRACTSQIFRVRRTLFTGTSRDSCSTTRPRKPTRARRRGRTFNGARTSRISTTTGIPISTPCRGTSEGASWPFSRSFSGTR